VLVDSSRTDPAEKAASYYLISASTPQHFNK